MNLLSSTHHFHLSKCQNHPFGSENPFPYTKLPSFSMFSSSSLKFSPSLESFYHNLGSSPHYLSLQLLNKAFRPPHISPSKYVIFVCWTFFQNLLTLGYKKLMLYFPCPISGISISSLCWPFFVSSFFIHSQYYLISCPYLLSSFSHPLVIPQSSPICLQPSSLSDVTRSSMTTLFLNPREVFQSLSCLSV